MGRKVVDMYEAAVSTRKGHFESGVENAICCSGTAYGPGAVADIPEEPKAPPAGVMPGRHAGLLSKSSELKPKRVHSGPDC